jgi:YesN/AraC family two-component response regulator
MFIEEGEAKYTINNTVYMLGPGDMAIVNCGVVHSESAVGDRRLKLWVCSFQIGSSLIAKNSQLIHDNVSPIVHTQDQSVLIQTLFNQLYNEQKFPGPYTDELCGHTFATLIIYVYRIINMYAQKEALCNTQKLINDVIKYIDENYNTHITLETLAHSFYISTSYIAHEMKRELGISPINYLISRRVGEAQKLLLSTNKSISSIAENVGYSNVYYFSRLFSKRIGCPPDEFRENYQINL